ncbi:MAG: type I restriction endonuclease subunit S [Sandaracinus sp.]|nr:type I restriction endonuclease subunit S [Sandaracinus sp.]
MTPRDLIAAFKVVSEAQEGVTRLRELVLQLAVRGQLVPQNEGEEPADSLLERLRAHRTQLIKSKAIKKPKKVPPVAAAPLPFQVPPTWSWARFVDVANIASNLVKPAKYPSAPHIAPNNIEKATGRLLPYQTVAEDGVRSAKHRFRAGQILYSKIRPNLSKVITVDFEGLCSADMYPIDPWIDRRYLHAYMLSMAFLEQATDDDNRLAMPKVNQEQLSAVMVAVPPLLEQKRIVAKVDELMGLLDRLEAARDSRESTRLALRNAALAALQYADSAEEVEVAWQRIAERMDDLFTDPADVEPLRQTVLQLAVRGRLVRQAEGDEPASVLLEQLAADKAQLVAAKKIKRPKRVPAVSDDAVPFALPQSWAWARFVAVANIASNLVKPGEHSSKPHIAPNNIEKGTGRLLPYQTVGDDGVTSSKHWFTAGQILYSKIRPNLSKVVTIDFDGLCSADMYPIDAWIDRDYLQAYMLSGAFLEQVTGDDNRLAMPKVNQEQLSRVMVAVPPLAEQRRIVIKLGELVGLLDRLAERLEDTKNLHRAFAAAAVHHLEA